MKHILLLRSQLRVDYSTRNKHLQKEELNAFESLNKEVMVALEVLKNALISPPVPAQLSSGGHILHATDACDVQASGVLLQKQLDDTVRPTKHLSLSLNNTKE